MNRVSFFVDGFNLYFSLRDAQRTDPKNRDFRWFNLKAYLSQFLSQNETISDVFYFSAFYPWGDSYPLQPDPTKEKRHRTLKRVFESTGIKTYFGHFNKNQKKCPLCNQYFEKTEEKQTDVCIALTIMAEAHKDTFDTAILVSGDTDFVPVVDALKNTFPGKKVGVLFPFNRVNVHLKKIADFSMKTKLKDLPHCKLDDPYTCPDGSIIACPVEWK